MKRFNVDDINSSDYWDKNQTAFDFGLRQEKYLELAGSGYSICEVGCGMSPFLHKAQDNFVKAVGYDFSPETIKKASNRYLNVDYVQLDANDLDGLNKKYDVVVAGEIIEHLQNPDKFIEDLKRIANNKVILSTPNLEFDDPEHLWEFDEQYFKDKGFETEVVESERFKGRKYIFAWINL